MPAKLADVLQEFADAIDQANPQKMGGIAVSAGERDLDKTAARMSDLARKNGYMMHIGVGIVVALFIFCIALAIYYRAQPNIALLVVGGNTLQLVLLVGWLRRLWIEKTAVETLLIAIEELPPADAAKILLAFYFKALKAK